MKKQFITEAARLQKLAGITEARVAPSEGRLFKENTDSTIQLQTSLMVDPFNVLFNPNTPNSVKIQDEEKDYIKSNLLNTPKMSPEEFTEKYNAYVRKFYDEADTLDTIIAGLKKHIEKGLLSKEEAGEALAIYTEEEDEDELENWRNWFID